MEVVILLWVPLAVGMTCGFIFGRVGHISTLVSLSASVVAAVGTVGAIVIWGIASGVAPMNPNNPHPLPAQWLGFTYLYGPGIFVFGAPAAIGGSLLGQILKTRLCEHQTQDAGTNEKTLPG